MIRVFKQKHLLRNSSFVAFFLKHDFRPFEVSFVRSSKRTIMCLMLRHINCPRNKLNKNPFLQDQIISRMRIEDKFYIPCLYCNKRNYCK